MKNATPSRGPLLDHLDAIEARCKKGDPTLKDIFDIFGTDGHFLLILFFILPFLQPIPMFGLSSICGLLIGAIAVLEYLKKPPYLPIKWQQKTLKASSVLKIAEGSEKIYEKVTFLLKPRWQQLMRPPFKILNVSFLVLNAFLLALPLPIPFSNAIPAWVIFFQTLAHLEDDGFFIILSYIQTVVSIFYFGLLLFGANSGVAWIRDQILPTLQ